MSTAAHETMPSHEDLVNERLVIWHFVMALTFLGISMLGGILVALQLVHWNPLNGIEYLSAGRWRMIHTNAVAYGFLANGFLGMLHWVVPRLTLHRVANNALSYFILDMALRMSSFVRLPADLMAAAMRCVVSQCV